MGGGKGGTTVQTQQIDPRLTEASVDTLNRAASAMAIPFVPNRGIQVADFSRQQKAGMMAADDAAGAFGMRQGGGLSTPGRQHLMSSGGVQGFGTGQMYDQAIDASIGRGLQRDIDLLFAPNDLRGSGGKGGGGGKGGSDIDARRERSRLTTNPYSAENLDLTRKQKRQIGL